MQLICAPFWNLGEDILASLEKRNPNLSMTVCEEKNIECAQSIERSETAINEEKLKLLTHCVPEPISPLHSWPDKTVSSRFASFTFLCNVNNCTPVPARADNVSAPLIFVDNIGHTLNPLKSEEILQLLHRDISKLSSRIYGMATEQGS